MTPEERTQAAEMAKAAWISGFTAARHWPNHALPQLSIHWDGNLPRVEPDWTQRLPGYIG